MMTGQGEKPQLERFKGAARQLCCDDDPDRLKERLGKLVKHKPVSEKRPGNDR